MKNILPGWEIVEKIGQGGFSTVYKIKKSDSAGDGEYYAALKVITIPHSPEEYENYAQDGYDDQTITAIFSNQVKKLEEEFRLMARFKGNSNIVSYEDHMIVPHEDGKGWDILIRMELLQSLTNRCKGKMLNEEDVIKLGIDICRALELCQKSNLVHRDIKPQNIFVNEFGDFKLGDFGIAKTMDHTTHATRIGTYGYIAPEVYWGKSYNSNVDIYSLGLVLYWLLNERRLPFLPLPPVISSSDDMEKAKNRRLNGEEISAPKHGSEELKRIVLKACSFNPSDRYATAYQMRRELENVLDVVVPLSGDLEAENAPPYLRHLSKMMILRL